MAHSNLVGSLSSRMHSVAGGAERTLFVLYTLAQHGEPISVNQLAKITDLAVSTLYRQLNLLKSWGFVQESDATYMPGPTCLQLAWGFDQSSWLVRESLPEMQNLSDKTNETVGLMVAVAEQVVCLEMVESKHSLRCTFVKGKGLSLLHGASAKSLLAFLPESRRSNVLQQCEAELQHQLQQEIVQIQEQGFATSFGEVDEGVWGVSVPLLSSAAKLLGTVTLMAPSSRAQNRKEWLIDLTRKCVARIEMRLRSLS